jgi:hypothetical protein
MHTHTHTHTHTQGEKAKNMFTETSIDPGAGEFVRRVKGELALISEKEKARIEGEKAIQAAVRALETNGDVRVAKEQVCVCMCVYLYGVCLCLLCVCVLVCFITLTKGYSGCC